MRDSADLELDFPHLRGEMWGAQFLGLDWGTRFCG
jgi:hypothetical protein